MDLSQEYKRDEIEKLRSNSEYAYYPSKATISFRRFPVVCAHPAIIPCEKFHASGMLPTNRIIRFTNFSFLVLQTIRFEASVSSSVDVVPHIH